MEAQDKRAASEADQIEEVNGMQLETQNSAKHTRWTVTLLVTALMLVGTYASAQTGGGYDLTWSSIDSGGGVSSGGGYELTGVIGQPDAAPAMTGGGYTLTGGFLQDSLFPPSNADVNAWSLY